MICHIHTLKDFERLPITFATNIEAPVHIMDQNVGTNMDKMN